MDSLKLEQRWCIWKTEYRNGRTTKVPYQDYTTRGSSSDQTCWKKYEEVLEIKEEHSEVGIGLYLSPSEANPNFLLCAIDIDAHHTNGEPNQYAEEVLSLFQNTYIEKSPSGNGHHVLCYFDQSKVDPANQDITSKDRILDADGNFAYYKKNADKELEIYIAGFTNRFMTVTEDTVNENSVIDQTECILDFLDRYMQKPETQRTRQRTTQQTSHEGPYGREGGVYPFPEGISIEDRLRIARRSKYREEFIALYDNGDISRCANDHSRADFALVRKLYYWLNGDPALIDRAFRSSALMRSKWDEQRGTITYGQLTIRSVLELNREVWLPRTQNPQGQRAQWEGEIGHQSDEIELTPDPTIYGGVINPEDVLNLINEVEDDEEHRDQITVLNLMCGTGKSSAIRLKIKQIVEANNGDGMIIVTDNTDRMRDYLNPPVSERDSDIELSQFFMNHSDCFTVMTSYTLREAARNQHRTPILIMATQRFVRLSHEQIEEYLNWDGGRRSLIIVDEQPMFKQQCNIHMQDVVSIQRSIIDGILSSETNKSRLAELWRRIEIHLNFVHDTAQFIYGTPGQYYYYYKPCLPASSPVSTDGPYVWPAPFRKELDLEMLDEAERLTNKYRHQINEAGNTDNNFIDVATKAQAVINMLKSYSLIQARIFSPHEHKAPKISFSYLLDNYEKYRNLDAKVIVLDGTADVSVSYQLYDDLDMRNCDQYKRDLSNRLKIKIIDLTTGKTSLNKLDKKEKALRVLNNYLQDNVPEGVHPVVFSYIDLKNELARRYGEENRDWFGNIKGKNDYRKATHIVQLGMNRFPEGSYFLYTLAKIPYIVERTLLGSETPQELLNSVQIRPSPRVNQIIQELIYQDGSFTKEVMWRELLADLEQNLFRGVIRNSGSNEEFHFYLFTSFQTSAETIRAIHTRYEGLHGQVEDVHLEEYGIDDVMQRNRNGQPTDARRIIEWHDHELPLYSFYTYQKISDETGLSKIRIRNARQDRTELNDWFTADNSATESMTLPGNYRTGGRGRPETPYYKTSNWYFDDAEEVESDDEAAQEN